MKRPSKNPKTKKEDKEEDEDTPNTDHVPIKGSSSDEDDDDGDGACASGDKPQGKGHQGTNKKTAKKPATAKQRGRPRGTRKETIVVSLFVGL